MRTTLSQKLAQRIADVLNDPVVDAVARASRAKLDGYRYIEPVIALKLNGIPWVIVRVGVSRPRHTSSHTNRFHLLDARGKPVFSGEAVTGLSTLAYMLRDTALAKAEIVPAEAATVRLTNRFKNLLHQPKTLITTAKIA